MRKLETEFNKSIFTYRQLNRTDKVAIYEQTFEDNVISYEVFKIRVGKEQEVFGTTIPNREKFCSDEDFGQTAWSIRDKDRATTKFKQLVNEEVHKKRYQYTTVI